MTTDTNQSLLSFSERFKGRFVALRKWSDLEVFWGVLKAQSEGWYAYAPGESVPVAPMDSAGLSRFVDELDALLRREHQEDYCGIVYVDDREHHDFIKIYDPNNLGSACSASTQAPLPGWVLSRIQPDALELPPVVPAARRRWWREMFGIADA